MNDSDFVLGLARIKAQEAAQFFNPDMTKPEIEAAADDTKRLFVGQVLRELENMHRDAAQQGVELPLLASMVATARALLSNQSGIRV